MKRTAKPRRTGSQHRKQVRHVYQIPITTTIEGRRVTRVESVPAVSVAHAQGLVYRRYPYLLQGEVGDGEELYDQESLTLFPVVS